MKPKRPDWDKYMLKEQKYVKISLLFFCLSLSFLFWEKCPEALGAYEYENIAFYAQANPSSYTREGTAFYAYTSETAGTLPVYRLYNSGNGDHLYTISEIEKNTAVNSYSYASEGAAFYAYSTQISGTSPIYRFQNAINGDHFYTALESEKNVLQSNPQWGYAYEGIAFYIFKTEVENSSLVYRLYNPSTGDHFYTASEIEANKISLFPVYRYYNPGNGDHVYTLDKSTPSNYSYEGIAFYASESEVSGNTPVYRLYNSGNGDHFYTISESEKTSASSNGYSLEGTAFYAYSTQVDGTSPVYRFYSSSDEDHFYTISESEKNNLQNSVLGPEIAVGLWNYSKSGIKDSPFKISANKKYNIKNKDGAIAAQVDGDITTRVTYDADSYLKAYGSISETKSKKVFYFDAADGDNSTLIFDVSRPSSDYDQYRGKIKIQYTDSSNIWVINTLPLEHYTWGMGETTGTGEFEHTKVMTAIFRTYGYWYIKYATKYNQYGFKIRSDSGSQIYRGYDWETTYPNIKKAAQGTRGIIATYDNDVALTPYSSWSDGRTRSFEERWGSTEYPWCQSVPDPYGKHPSLSTSELVAAGNHMVGLVAHGSLNLAGDDYDWSYSKIMTYYYTGITLGTIY